MPRAEQACPACAFQHLSRDDAGRKIETPRQHYNESRPHASPASFHPAFFSKGC
jgi:hypothetical protein